MAISRNLKPALTVIVSVVVSLFFGYAAYLFSSGYADFKVETQRLQVSLDLVAQAKQQRQRVEQYNTAMVELGKFTSQVERLGLAPENWQSYAVSVNRSLSLIEAGNIIEQLGHSKSYYFQPKSLYLGSGVYRAKPVATADTSQTISQSGQSAASQADFSAEDQRSGELTLDVQGKFIVRDGT